MMEPKRLRESGAADHVAKLLNAASHGGPDPQATLRVRRALGIGVPLAAAGSVGAAATAKAAWLSTTAKWILGVALVSGGVGGGVLVLSRTPTAEQRQVAPVRTQTVVPVEVDPTLAAEVKALDEVRREITAGHFDNGLARLGNYGDQFPKPSLHPESLLLQHEALKALGRYNEARAVARTFLEQYPQSPLAARLKLQEAP